MLKRLRESQQGVAMVEATFGVIFLLFAALIVIQFSLVFHGMLAAHGAATRSARILALTGDIRAAQSTYYIQTATTLRALTWEAPDCQIINRVAQCTATVNVPAVLPGSGVFAGGGLRGPLPFAETGFYPVGEAG